MSGRFAWIVPALVLLALVAASETLIAQTDSESAQSPGTQSSGTSPANPPAPEPPSSAAPPPAAPAPVPPAPGPLAPAPAGSVPSVTILDTQDARGILGNEVRSAANEDMGRIADVIVDGEGRTRAAIIDFGGFLGVGSRKIAVDWKALHFVPAASKRYGIVLELTRDQVKLAPEYKEGKPIVILGALGNLEPLP